MKKKSREKYISPYSIGNFKYPEDYINFINSKAKKSEEPTNRDTST